MYSYRNLLSTAAVAICSMSFNAAAALNIPNMGSSSNYDEFRTSSGVVCRQSLSGTAQVQIGGILAQDNSNDLTHHNNIYNNGYRDRSESGVFVQLVVPIGQRDRVECKTLYNIEVEKQAIELQQLKSQLEVLKRKAALAGIEGLPEL